MLDVIVSEVLLYGDYYSLTTLSERTSSLSSSSYTYLSFQDLLNLREPYSELSYTDDFSIFDTVYQFFDLSGYKFLDNNLLLTDILYLDDVYNSYLLQETNSYIRLTQLTFNQSLTDNFQVIDVVKISYLTNNYNDLLFSDANVIELTIKSIDTVLYQDKNPLFDISKYTDTLSYLFNSLSNISLYFFENTLFIDNYKTTYYNAYNEPILLNFNYEYTIEGRNVLVSEVLNVNDVARLYLNVFTNNLINYTDNIRYLLSSNISDALMLFDNSDGYFKFKDVLILNSYFISSDYNSYLDTLQSLFDNYQYTTGLIYYNDDLLLIDTVFGYDRKNKLHLKDKTLYSKIEKTSDKLLYTDFSVYAYDVYINDTLLLFNKVYTLRNVKEYDTLSLFDGLQITFIIQKFNKLKLNEITLEIFSESIRFDYYYNYITQLTYSNKLTINDYVILNNIEWTRVHFTLSDSLTAKTFFNIKLKETLNIFEFTKPLLISNVKYVDTFAISDVFIDRNILNTILLNTITNQFTFITYPISFIKNNNVYTLNGKAITSTSISNNLITLKFNNLSTQSVKRIDKIYTNAITETSTAELNNITLVNNKYVFNVPKGLRAKEYSLTLKNLSDVEYINIRLISEDRNKI